MGDIEGYEEQAQPPATLFHTDDPVEIVARATRTADALAAVVKAKQLATRISGREHVRVEGWTLLGSMLGVFPVTVWTRQLDDGWEARVEVRTRSGEVVGAAEAECRTTEKTWSSRDSYAVRSMAQTRATSKALRHPLGFVMTLAGFDATPAEEMPRPVEYQETATPLAQNWRMVLDALNAANVTQGTEWLRQACESLSIASLEDASHDDRVDVLKRMNTVLEKLAPFSDASFPPPSTEEIQQAFAAGFDGVILDGPPVETAEAADEDIAWPEEEPAK